jgi:hypothetical protein
MVVADADDSHAYVRRRPGGVRAEFGDRAVYLYVVLGFGVIASLSARLCLRSVPEKTSAECGCASSLSNRKEVVQEKHGLRTVFRGYGFLRVQKLIKQG